MNPIIAKGNHVASILQQQVKTKLNLVRASNNALPVPRMAYILVGESSASKSYVKRKMDVSQKVGIESELHQFSADVQEATLLDQIRKLNHDTRIDGILVQLPLPIHLNRQTVIHAIQEEKDVDCLHSANLQRLILNGELQEMLPCTPAGVLELLDYYKINVRSMNATIIGRSHLVGYPLSILLMKRNATVTLCHRDTTNLREHVEKADLLIAAAGQRHLVKGDWIKPGAIVIDVGINQALPQDPHKIVGDVDFQQALNRCSLITPVPGGVGPMTICRLMINLQNIYLKKHGLQLDYNKLPPDYNVD